MSTFSDLHATYEWDNVNAHIMAKQAVDVERALAKSGALDVEDFAALISPAASPYLEAMARKSSMLTRKRFGHTMQMYLPLYLSNECTNSCTYCGFSHENSIPRRTLSMDEILQEIHTIKAQWPYEHILLVTGEDVRHTPMEQIESVVK